MATFEGLEQYGFNANLDVENIMNGLTSTIHQGTRECGARPTCMGWSEGCKQKQQAYYECNKVASASKASAISSVAKIAIIGSLVLGGIIIVAIMFKRK